jgi:hypothetical protein
MNLNAFMQTYADEIGGQYSEYDSARSIIIVPLNDDRFQTVFGKIKHSERYGRMGVEFSSKVCAFNKKIDLQQLLIDQGWACHAKFVLDEDYLKVEASAFLETATEPLLKEIIQEVANIADEYEWKLTGQDIH